MSDTTKAPHCPRCGMSDTTKAPHCPRCGGEMVRQVEDGAGNSVFTCECEACGFGGTGSSLRFTSYERDHSIKVARRLVRAELARQEADYFRAAVETRYSPGACRADILTRYEWLGTRPLRLPGEEA